MQLQNKINYIKNINKNWNTFQVNRNDIFHCLRIDYRQLFCKKINIKYNENTGQLESDSEDFIALSDNKNLSDSQGIYYGSDVTEGFFLNELLNKLIGMNQTQIVVVPDNISIDEQSAYVARCKGINLHVLTETEFLNFKQQNIDLVFKEIPAINKDKNIGDISFYIYENYYNKYPKIKSVWEKNIKLKSNSVRGRGLKRKKTIVFDFDKTLTYLGKFYNKKGDKLKLIYKKDLENINKLSIDHNIVILTWSDKKIMDIFANFFNKNNKKTISNIFRINENHSIISKNLNNELNIIIDKNPSKLNSLIEICKQKNVIAYVGDGLNDLAPIDFVSSNGGIGLLTNDCFIVLKDYFAKNKKLGTKVLMGHNKGGLGITEDLKNLI